MDKKYVPVFIVGGSLVGLSTSLFLSAQGIPSLLVERHPGLSIHPRAGGFYPRTMELFRSVGIEKYILEKSAPSNKPFSIAKVESLAGPEYDRTTFPKPEDLTDLTPCTLGLIMQDKLEPILRKQAEKLGGDIMFSTECLSFQQDSNGVNVLIRNRKTGAKEIIQADYLVAADGNRSQIRQALSIRKQGRGTLLHQISMLFQTDLKPLLRDPSVAAYRIQNDKIQGGYLNIYDRSSQIGMLSVPCAPEQLKKDEESFHFDCVEWIRAALGNPHQKVKILSTLPWEMASWVAEQYQSGRVFLVGDAAHVMPPIGGFGANTGIHDAHNLAWKLAHVFKNNADPGFLDTYEKERQPIGQLTVEQATLKLGNRAGPSLEESTKERIDDLALSFGYRYDSDAIIHPTDDARFITRNPRDLDGEPGTRAPHVWLEYKGKRLSTIDLFQKHFVLFVGKKGDTEGFRALCEETGILLDIYLMDKDLLDVNQCWHDQYGITFTGAVLVRPDGFVAWRQKDTETESKPAFLDALKQLFPLKFVH